MYLVFPSFNLYSTPLLVLVTQGIIFGLLLLHKFSKGKNLSFLFLALLVLITCFHRTTYTIGFMDWYDTFRNTKINYWLINFSLAIGPLIYFYVKSITVSNFRFKRQYWLHFVPALLFALYKIAIFIYDALQPGFDDTQNGFLMSKLAMGPTGTFIETFNILQQLLYLAFSLQLYFIYRKRIKDYFSNTYRLELNWVRNFLFIYTFLFLYSIVQQLVDFTVTELSWIQKWWYQFFSALAVIYIGIKGFFTDTSSLTDLILPTNRTSEVKSPLADKSTELTPANNTVEIQNNKKRLLNFMETEKPYLDPELNLKQLAESVQLTRTQLSETINTGFNKNFNDFINDYRVERVKKLFSEGKQQKLSLLGVAYDSGFNSKATFNRVFKKFTGSSPSEFLKSLY